MWEWQGAEAELKEIRSPALPLPEVREIVCGGLLGADRMQPRPPERRGHKLGG